MRVDSLKQRLSNGEVIILDGGIGTELTGRGVAMDREAWAGTAVLEHEDELRAMHADYVRAGADVITANTYQTSHQSLIAAGRGDMVVEINRRSAHVACQVRDNADRPVLVAAALFPGYRSANRDTLLPDPAPDTATVRAWLSEQTSVIAEAGVDLFALEMVPSAYWGRLALEAVAQTGLPVWIGVSHTPPRADRPRPGVGDLLAELLPDTAQADVMAITVMHTQIEDVDAALDEIAEHWDGALGVYPHHGRWCPERDVPEFVPTPIDAATFTAACEDWVRRGVQIVGGCCGITPAHVRDLKDRLPDRTPAPRP